MIEAARRLEWLNARVIEVRVDNFQVKTIVSEASGWTGHAAGQHVDIRLTAPDGYQAQRSYSIANAPGDGQQVGITVQRVDNGEVSPFLVDELRVGDTIELRGPIGGYFTWEPGDGGPLLLLAGGSGVVPLMCMLRTRAKAGDLTPVTLLYSSRSDRHIIYREELDRLAAAGDGFTLVHTLTHERPECWIGETGLIDRPMLKRHGPDRGANPQSFLCGPTPFVEAVANHLVALGYAGDRIKTERFGPSGDVK